MKQVHRHAIVLYSAEKMFDLVNDVKRYPEFLPWCSAAKILSATEQEMLASITIAKGHLQQTFSTRNTLLRPQCIRMTLVDGPFENLSGEWQFVAMTEHACKVSLDLVFSFAKNFAQMAIGKTFDRAADSLVDAFCKRARDLYEPRKIR